MANNELTGPILAAELIKLIQNKKNRNYSYRFVFAPETIGHISYINQIGPKNLNKILHGFNLTCLGIGDEWNVMPTRNGNTYTDFVIEFLLKSTKREYKIRNFLSRGSDERQYNSPNVNVQMVSAMRGKYHEFENYHTNLDNLENLNFETYMDSINTYFHLIELLEIDGEVSNNFIGEPFLNSVSALSSIGGQSHFSTSLKSRVLDFLTYCDGKSVLEIMEKININTNEMFYLVNFLKINKMAIFKTFGSKI
jgi:aminopeptidase-like protein